MTGTQRRPDSGAVPYFVYELADPVHSWSEVRSDILAPEHLASRGVVVRFLAVFHERRRAEEFLDLIQARPA